MAKDVSKLAELSAQLGYPTTMPQCAARVAGISGSEEHEVIVACSDDGAVIAWIHVFMALRVESDAFAELGGFVVGKRHRGRGIGRRLLAAAEKWASRKGLEKLRVRSRSDRVEAGVFYERLGFSPSKEQRVFDKVLKREAE